MLACFSQVDLVMVVLSLSWGLPKVVLSPSLSCIVALKDLHTLCVCLCVFVK